ncbi:YHYH domain-containing protein [Gammaproteobacteria bacterium 2W06]|nr:YHYH domain-containing protein [Gammaproteobacteria bacterium 2W06]
MLRQYLLCLALLMPAAAVAHGGGTDANGCHTDGNAGEYHCHQGDLDGQRFDSKQQAIDSGAIAGEPDGSSGSGGYDRDQYEHWIDADDDCQDTRQEVLIRQGHSIRFTGDGCRVRSGRWTGPYTGAQYTDPADLHVDHVVPLAEAHRSGAADWSASRKRDFANSMGNLLAVDARENMSKGGDDPAGWMPEVGKCRYAQQWLRVKQRWGLAMDSNERQALQSQLARCP